MSYRESTSRFRKGARIPPSGLILSSFFYIHLLASVGTASSAVLVEAHRGDSSNAPENTIASIQSAAGAADLTEMDIRVTADGELVLMHDPTVDRTTDGSGSVSSMTLAQIKTLDAGIKFSPEFVGERVPTMYEAASAAMGLGIMPLIERKAGSAVSYHNAFLSYGWTPDDFYVIAFDWNFLDDLDVLNPDYYLGALGSGTITQAVIDSVVAKGADFLDWSYGGITQAAVDLVHANGLEIHAWTVNDTGWMRTLIEYGVDGITTDYPHVLREILIDIPELMGDLNLDGELTAADWLIYHSGRGVDLSGMTIEESYFHGDLDRDLDNDLADFLIFKNQYEKVNGAESWADLLAVPEPSSVALVVMGWFVLFVQFARDKLLK